jgi:hypothetical protein
LHARARPAPALARDSLGERIAQIRVDAAARGAAFITLRGLAERLGCSGSQLAELRAGLGADYEARIWRVQPSAGSNDQSELRPRPERQKIALIESLRCARPPRRPPFVGSHSNVIY